MQINRGDMKLLTECGFSGVLRDMGTDLTPIFDALETWMPEHGAGAIGLALQMMAQGKYDDAEAQLREVIRKRRGARDEARAMLAMLRTLKNDMAAVEDLASELEGKGGAAENFARLLIDSNRAQVSQEDQGPAKATAG